LPQKSLFLLVGRRFDFKAGKKMESSKWYGKVATVLIYLGRFCLWFYFTPSSRRFGSFFSWRWRFYGHCTLCFYISGTAANSVKKK
jgi:NhaP-type Na+/H+ or K+/H+ antiporter